MSLIAFNGLNFKSKRSCTICSKNSWKSTWKNVLFLRRSTLTLSKLLRPKFKNSLLVSFQPSTWVKTCMKSRNYNRVLISRVFTTNSVRMSTPPTQWRSSSHTKGNPYKIGLTEPVIMGSLLRSVKSVDNWILLMQSFFRPRIVGIVHVARHWNSQFWTLNHVIAAFRRNRWKFWYESGIFSYNWDWLP